MSRNEDTVLHDAATHVIKVIREVMNVDEVGLDTDFYAIGGHSLLAIEVIARLRNEYGLGLPARQFLNDATVAAIAAACSPVEPISED
jgi:acyl carrier protein